MKHFILCLSLLLASTLFAQRAETLLTHWEFAKETAEHTMPQKGWTSVLVPHDWAIFGPFSIVGLFLTELPALSSRLRNRSRH